MHCVVAVHEPDQFADRETCRVNAPRLKHMSVGVETAHRGLAYWENCNRAATIELEYKIECGADFFNNNS